MTKLQKNGQTASTGTAPLHGAVPYENLPQSLQQPVPVRSTLAPNPFDDLPSTNPFSSNFSPQPIPSVAAQSIPAVQVFSPVSPLNETPTFERVSQPRVHAPEPQRPAANKRSVNLQRLDGKPYPTSATSHTEKPVKPVRVAKDMFDGALPPVYKRQASDPIQPADVAQAAPDAHECTSCGKKRPDGGSCNQCGKRRSSETGTGQGTRSTHNRTTSAGVASERSIASSTTAAPSSSSSQGCCTRCGRHKRLDSMGSPSAPASLPAANSAQQPSIKIQRPGLSIQSHSAGSHNSMYPQIDVIPPSTTTYRRTNTVPSPFTPYGDDSPLVNLQAGQHKKPESRSSFRNNSIVRSLSRRLSRRDKEKDKSAAPLPSQQLAASENQSGEQSAGRLINMISSAMQEPSNSRDQQYSKLSTEVPDRPASPFSFMGERDESDAFEMKRVEAQQHDDREYMPNQQDRLDVIPRPKSADPHHGRHLTPEDAELRPQITRFKSLRVGVNRVNQSISRSQSLKRLGSVKVAHHAWYVDGTDENSVPVF